MSEENKRKTKTESRSESRNHIFNIIFQGEFNNFTKEELEEALSNYYEVLEAELEEEEINNPGYRHTELNKDFIENELYGIAENLPEIDNAIGRHCVGWSVSRIAKVDLAILRLAVYEILFSSDIPNAVAVNEAVELAKKYSSEKSPSFINGILGNIVKNNG